MANLMTYPIYEVISKNLKEKTATYHIYQRQEVAEAMVKLSQRQGFKICIMREIKGLE